jgi:hypothetical protein
LGIPVLNLPDQILGVGAVIRIGNSSYSTYDSTNGIFLSPGFGSFITVDREFKSMLPKPYSNCEVDSNSPAYRANSKFYNLIGQSEYAYSQQLCFSQCLQDYFISKYKCAYPNMLSLFNVTQCDQSILDIITGNDTIFDDDYIRNTCTHMCPLECNQTLYKTSISSYQLNGNEFIFNITNNSNLALDFVNRTIDATTARESFVQVNIFYSSLSYTSTTESPQMDLVYLLASIGGNLGLFLGVSVFSLCEIVQVLIEIYFIVIKIK